MASSTKDRKPAPLPAPNSDFYELVEPLPPDELAVLEQMRTLMQTKVVPIITALSCRSSKLVAHGHFTM